jgi:hypothetical protein
MPTRPDWRISSATEPLNQLDRAGFAWEFLRRNPQYKREFAQLPKDAASREAGTVVTGERWGLCFRVRSRISRSRSTGDLAAGACAAQRHSRARAALLHNSAAPR